MQVDPNILFKKYLVVDEKIFGDPLTLGGRTLTLGGRIKVGTPTEIAFLYPNIHIKRTGSKFCIKFPLRCRWGGGGLTLGGREMTKIAKIP